MRKQFNCPQCGVVHTKTSLEKAIETTFDEVLQAPIARPMQKPVIVNYSVGKKRFERPPDAHDLEIIQTIVNMESKHWFPAYEMMFKGIKWGDSWRAGYHAGITHTHHFYTKRNLFTLASLWHKLRSEQLDPLADFLFTSTLPWTTRLNRLIVSNYFRKGGGVIAPTLPGTLYISSLNIETNPIVRFRLRVKSAKHTANGSNYAVSCQSANQFPNVPDGSVDYIFVDPPFGENIMYAELNFLMESWLRTFTNQSMEAIISKSQRKDLIEYLRLMESCF